MLRPLSAFILVILTLPAMACDREYTFQVGPFFSTSSILKYWQDFAIKISKRSKCSVKMITSPSYEVYLSSIIDKKYDLFITPDHYVKAFMGMGFIPALSSVKSAQIYLVSRHDLTAEDLTPLIGEKILVPSIYTRAYLELENWLKKNNLIDKVTFDFNHSHDSAALIMLKGAQSSTTMLASIYDSLPDFVKAKYSAIPISEKAGAYLHIRPDLPNKLVGAIKNSSSHLKFHKWFVATPPFSEPYQDVFVRQLEEFQAKTTN